MKTRFTYILIFIMFSLVYSHKSAEFENVIQDILSNFKGEDSKNASNTVLKKNHSEIISLYNIPRNPETDDLRERVDVKMIMNPITNKLVDMDIETADVKQYFLTLFSKVAKYDNLVKKSFFNVAGVVFITMLITSKTIFSGIIFSFANFAFSLSRGLIIFAALITPIFWFTLKYNFYTHMNGISFLGPVVLLLSSSACLKIYDFNNPIWNRMISSFICVAGSAAIIRVV